ncbi:hypothetical protein ACIA59_24020 [Micromonospora haikouensis]|uniref:hypothetical protein n=1 Tax=Micromonospora haikouensis TaxID=686309 RepID=UPI0037B8F0AB
MVTIPRVCASGARIAELDDIGVHLLTVETWTDRVTVRLVAAGTGTVRQRMDSREVDLIDWTRRRNAGSDEPPPKTPGEELMDALTVEITDELGTAYCWVGKSGGGSGTELLAEWYFAPALPSQAPSVTVTVTTAGGAQTVTALLPPAE